MPSTWNCDRCIANTQNTLEQVGLLPGCIASGHGYRALKSTVEPKPTSYL